MPNAYYLGRGGGTRYTWTFLRLSRSILSYIGQSEHENMLKSLVQWGSEFWTSPVQWGLDYWTFKIETFWCFDLGWFNIRMIGTIDTAIPIVQTIQKQNQYRVIQDGRYSNGMPSHETLPFECWTPILSCIQVFGIQMVTVFDLETKMSICLTVKATAYQPDL